MTNEPEVKLSRAATTGLRLWALATVILCGAFMLHPARADFYKRAWHFVQQNARPH